MKIEKGQEVVVVGIGNNSRYSTPVHKAIVTKIGRKWFEVDSLDDYHWLSRDKFSLENGKCDGKGYNPEWQVFESQEAYNDKNKRPNLISAVNKILHKLSNEELDNILILVKDR